MTASVECPRVECPKLFGCSNHPDLPDTRLSDRQTTASVPPRLKPRRWNRRERNMLRSLDRSAKTPALALMACLLAAWLQVSVAPAGATDAKRTLSFTNQCSFDVWLQAVGSNAAVIACTPSSESVQANCPSGFICYNKNVNTNYCVPGTTSAKPRSRTRRKSPSTPANAGQGPSGRTPPATSGGSARVPKTVTVPPTRSASRRRRSSNATGATSYRSAGC